MPWVAYLPIISTLCCVYFFNEIYRHWRAKPGAFYLMWWTIGVFCYGLGTLLESIHTLAGWSPVVFKAWYIAGAFLGGVPLAQGTVYLLMPKAIAHKMTAVLGVVLVISAGLVVASPLDVSAVSDKLNGNVLEWSFIRAITPVINIYAFIFLVGGALYSAGKYLGNAEFKGRFWGNGFIALGGLLPGIGGTMAKFGQTYVLYVTELIGIVLIYAGYSVIRRDRSLSIHPSQARPQTA